MPATVGTAASVLPLYRQNAIPELTGGTSACRCWIHNLQPMRPRVPDRCPNVYIRLLPDRRDFSVYHADEVEDEDGVVPAGLLTAEDLPDVVTEERLCEFLQLEERAEELEERFHDACSSMSYAFDPDDYQGRLSAKEYRLQQLAYEDFLEEHAYVYNTYGKEVAAAVGAYKAAKEALLNDLYGQVVAGTSSSP